MIELTQRVNKNVPDIQVERDVPKRLSACTYPDVNSGLRYL